LLDDALWARVQRLDQQARDLLALVSLAGRPITREAAAHASGLPAELQIWLTGALCTQRLLSSEGVRPSDTIEPYHDRVRETVVARTSPEVRSDHHRRLARAFQTVADVDPEMIGDHLVQAGAHQEAQRYFVQAGAEATRVLAFERAARAYERALDLLSDDAAERRDCLIHLGDALVNAGRGRDAAHAYLGAVAAGTTEPPDSPRELENRDLKRRAAEHLVRSGHLHEATRLLREVLASARVPFGETPRRALARLLWRRFRLWLRGMSFRERPESAVPHELLRTMDTSWSVAIGLSNSDMILSTTNFTLHLLLALRASRLGSPARALAMEALMHVFVGHDQRRIWRLLAEAERLASAADDPEGHAYADLVGALAYGHRTEWAPVLPLLERAEENFRKVGGGKAFELANAVVWRIEACWFLGDLVRLRDHVFAAIGDADRRGDYFLASNVRLAFGNNAWLVEDDPEAARREADDAIAGWPNEAYLLQHIYHLCARDQINLYVGGRGAWDWLATEWSKPERSLGMRIAFTPTMLYFHRGQAALAAIADRETSDHERVMLCRDARRSVRRLRAIATPLAAMHADLVDAGVCIESGKREQAIKLLRRAETTQSALGLTLYAAAARMELGELSGGESGRLLATQATAHFVEQGVRDPRRFARILVAGLDLVAG
jgi:hypothetical protein